MEPCQTITRPTFSPHCDRIRFYQSTFDDDDDDNVFVVCLNDDGRLVYFQPGLLSLILTIANLRHAAGRIWTSTEPKFRLWWMKCVAVITTIPCHDKIHSRQCLFIRKVVSTNHYFLSEISYQHLFPLKHWTIIELHDFLKSMIFQHFLAMWR